MLNRFSYKRQIIGAPEISPRTVGGAAIRRPRGIKRPPMGQTPRRFISESFSFSEHADFAAGDLPSVHSPTQKLSRGIMDG